MDGRKRALVVAVIAVIAVIVPLAAFGVVMQKPSATQQPTATPTTAPTLQPTMPPIPADLSIHVNPVDGLNPDFMMGADVSMISQMEANGAKFYVNGVAKDVLEILRDHGVNWVRLRLWNDPTDAKGQPLGGGNNDIKTTAAIAVRAKQLGLKFLLDFHYSDWWADPGKQNMPKAWVGLSSEALVKAVYDYTAGAIKDLAKAGAMPDMVQIGNEINGGMMWPAGQTFASGSVQIGGYDGLAALLKSGIKAVRDADPNAADPQRRARIVIHLANGGDNLLYHTVFDALTTRGVDFDVIGLSYYGYWHGPLAGLIANMNDISQRYHKPVAVVETAYAYTLNDSDATADLFDETSQTDGGYLATAQGQATSVRDVIAAVAQVPNGMGLGIFYWEPDWYAVSGAGWQTGQGDQWDNQAMFDPQGNALQSTYVFRLVRATSGSVPVDATITGVTPIELEIPVNTLPHLPATIKATYSDDSIRDTPVTWQIPNVSTFAKDGIVTVKGTADGTSFTAKADVTVTSEINYAKNPGFETGTLAPWSVEGDSSAVNVSNEIGNRHAGAWALHYWLDKPFAATASQVISGLPAGTYSLSAWFQGVGGEKTLQLFVTCGGDTKSVAVVNTGWQKWTQPAIDNIAVTGGTCTIGMKVDAGSGTWGFIDDFKLVKAG
jgi:arabinogalactan endo-1,4-beta-galactosidase